MRQPKEMSFVKADLPPVVWQVFFEKLLCVLALGIKDTDYTGTLLVGLGRGGGGD